VAEKSRQELALMLVAFPDEVALPGFEHAMVLAA
jgi:hypothetical protein